MRSIWRKFGYFKAPLKKGQELKKLRSKRHTENFIVATEVNSEGKTINKIDQKISNFVDVQVYDEEYHQPGLRAGEKAVPNSPYLYPFTVRTTPKKQKFNFS